MDGVFECGFIRQRYVENTEKIFDLEKPWNILFATGRAKNGELPRSNRKLSVAILNSMHNELSVLVVQNVSQINYKEEKHP